MTVGSQDGRESGGRPGRAPSDASPPRSPRPWARIARAAPAPVAAIAALALLGTFLGEGGEPPPAAEGRSPRAGPASEVPGRDPGGLTAPEARGRQIYEEGTAPSGRPNLASLDGEDWLPATLFRCANCHGADGRGVAEGGLEPPDITWEALIRPDGRGRNVGPPRPPYDDLLIKRAIGSGIDPAGRPLRAGMPRYRMDLRDLEDLAAYLKRLGRAPLAPGLAPESVRLTLLLPPTESASPSGRAPGRVLRSLAGSPEGPREIYGRRVVWESLELSGDHGAWAGQVGALLDRDEPFAVALAGLPGPAAGVVDLLAARGVPAIGGSAPDLEAESTAHRSVFYLDGGIAAELIVALERAAAGRGGPPRGLCVLGDGGPATRRHAEAVEAWANRRGIRVLDRLALPAGTTPEEADGLVGRLIDESADVLCLLGEPGRWLPLLRAAGRREWCPHLVLPGSLATPRIFDIPPPLLDRLTSAFAQDPAAGAPDPRLGRLAAEARFPAGDPIAARHALAAALLLEEALMRSGREVTRASLISTLEGFRRVSTGVVAEVDYGPARRIGAPGAHPAVLRPDTRSFLVSTRRLVPEE